MQGSAESATRIHEFECLEPLLPDVRQKEAKHRLGRTHGDCAPTVTNQLENLVQLSRRVLERLMKEPQDEVACQKELNGSISVMTLSLTSLWQSTRQHAFMS